MRRSHRFALAGACALALLVAAGRLATRAAPRDAESPAAARPAGDRDALRAAAAATRARASAAEADESIANAALASPASFSLSDAPADARQARFAPTAAADPIELDDPQTAFGAAVALHGRDPGAPRAIDVWRLVGSQTARIATGRSRSDGTLEVPALVLPAGDVTLIASPRGEGPASPLASTPVVASRDPSPPRLVAQEPGAGADTWVLQVEPAEPSGSIVVARDSQPQIERVAVVAAGEARMPLAIAIALAPDDAELRIAQELPDGRRSAWRTVVLDHQPQGE